MSKASDAKKLAAAMEMFASLSKETGIALDVEKIIPMDQMQAAERREELIREADGVMASLSRPDKFKVKMCLHCKLPFSTNYRSVGCCSNYCRTMWLKSNCGPEWTQTRETWGEYEPPLVISAKSFAQLEKWARALLADAERIRSLLLVQSFETPVESLFDFDSVPLTSPDSNSSYALLPETPQPEPHIQPRPSTIAEIPVQATYSPQHLILEEVVFDFG